MAFQTSYGRLVFTQAKQKHARALNRIVNEKGVNEFVLLPKPVSLKSTRERIRKSEREFLWVVAELNGKAVGSADLMAFFGRSSHVATFSIAFGKEGRGKGFARVLLQTLFSFAKSLGIEIISSTAFDDNKLAMDFYRKLGFKKVGVLKDHLKRDGKYVDLALIVKKL